VVPTPVPAPPPVVPKPALSDGARAQALLDGQAPPAPSAAAERFIVQVGAFAEAARAQQVRQKLERAGQKTYTHVADTPEGKRIRVRLGPFASRSDAEKAAAKAKALGLTPSVLTL
jgi:DedD protein